MYCLFIYLFVSVSNIYLTWKLCLVNICKRKTLQNPCEDFASSFENSTGVLQTSTLIHSIIESTHRPSVHSLLMGVWLWCVAQVLLPGGQVFGVNSSGEERHGLLLRDAGRHHNTVSRLQTTADERHSLHTDDRNRHTHSKQTRLDISHPPVHRCGHTVVCR